MTQPTSTTFTLGSASTPLTVTERGQGRAVLLLHGGAGLISVAAFAGLLAEALPARVLTPVHPGFGGTPRPEELNSIGGLAALYEALLEQQDLEDVVVIGNSIGGWIAAELALRHSPRVGQVVLVDAVGIQVEGHPVADPFKLNLNELMALSYFDPAPFRIDLSAIPEPQRAAMAANRVALGVYGGQPSMGDPTLRARLEGVKVPALVLWGEADRVCDVTYGRAYAEAIPNAKFVLLERTGHVPQLETPAALLKAIAAGLR